MKIKLALATHPFVYDDLKNRTTQHLSLELGRTERLIDFSRAPKATMSAGSRFINADGSPFRFSPSDAVKYGRLADGEWLDAVDGADLEFAKRFVYAFVEVDLQRLGARNQLQLSPKMQLCKFSFWCSPAWTAQSR
jgi:hypothetical protein